MSDEKIEAQVPVEIDGLRITHEKHSAGGFPAVKAGMQHAFGEMGVVRGTKMLTLLNQTEGFDCPGCAWPDPSEKRAKFEFCENGAKAVAEEATTKRVTAEFFAEHSVAGLSKQSDHWLGKSGRLTEPMVLREGSAHYEPISWQDAFRLIADELNSLDNPDEAVFYTSGRTSNEAAFLYQLFARQLGTNNLPDCSNMCHESSGAALNETIGVGKGTVSLEEVETADTLFIIGQNPGTNHPRMLSALQKAVRHGCRIVSVNPLREAGLLGFMHPQEVSGMLGIATPLTKLYLQLKINGDVALLKGIAKQLLALEDESGDVFDHKFISEFTHSYDEYIEALRSADWDEIVEASGVSIDEIKQAAEILRTGQRVIFCWAMGLTQHKNAVANIQEIVNLLLLGGHIGKPGSGVCPVRGHSNVQGDRTMGIWEKMPDPFLDKLGAEFGFEPPRKHGYDTVAAIHAMLEGGVKFFMGMGGNFLSSTPDTEATAKALQSCRMTVHVSTKLNRSHLVTGKTALILPCLGRTERDIQESGAQFVTVEDSMSMVHASYGSLKPGSKNMKSECAIIGAIAAHTLGSRSTVDWAGLVADYDRIRDHVASVVPGFEDFNRRARIPDGFLLPNGARERDFKTETGKANFTVHLIPPDPLLDGEYLLMTIRSHDQYNTTIYGLDDRYRGIHNGRRVIFMNRDDMRKAGLNDADYVDITSRFEDDYRTVSEFRVVPYDIPRRCTAAYFPEVNALVPLRSVADKSNTPTSKSIVVSVRRAVKEAE